MVAGAGRITGAGLGVDRLGLHGTFLPSAGRPRPRRERARVSLVQSQQVGTRYTR
jgi:hypothetical protein